MTSQNIVYERKDLLTGTQQIIVDRDLMLQAIGANHDMIALLRDIRELLNLSIPAAQLIPVPQVSTVSNAGPVDINFMGGGAQKAATFLVLQGSASFYFDFDRPASTNSPQFVAGGPPIILPNVEVARLSVLGTSATPLYINAFTTQNPPSANYITVRAWTAMTYRDGTRY
jgi:rhodanese-related sulfurtransferase